MSQQIPTSEILNRAADLIEERGWRRGGGWFDTGDNALCAEGAIKAASGIAVKWKCPAWRAVAEYLAHDTSIQIQPVTGLPIVWVWNDSHARDAAEVIATLRAAALVEAAKEEPRRSVFDLANLTYSRPTIHADDAPVVAADEMAVAVR